MSWKGLYKVCSAIDGKACGLVYLSGRDLEQLREAHHLDVILYDTALAGLPSGKFPPSSKTLTLHWDDEKEVIRTYEPKLAFDLLVRQLQSME